MPSENTHVGRTGSADKRKPYDKPKDRRRVGGNKPSKRQTRKEHTVATTSTTEPHCTNPKQENQEEERQRPLAFNTTNTFNLKLPPFKSTTPSKPGVQVATPPPPPPTSATPEETNACRDQFGFPSYAQWQCILEEYMAGLHKRKRSKALICQAIHEQIYDVLSDTDAIHVGTPQFRFWARKMFVLVEEGGAAVITNGGRPVAVKEHIYEILCMCHAEAGHMGRDKTCKVVREYYTWIPKELVANFVKACPTCVAKRTGNPLPQAIYPYGVRVHELLVLNTPSKMPLANFMPTGGPNDRLYHDEHKNSPRHLGLSDAAAGSRSYENYHLPQMATPNHGEDDLLQRSRLYTPEPYNDPFYRLDHVHLNSPTDYNTCPVNNEERYVSSARPLSPDSSHLPPLGNNVPGGSCGGNTPVSLPSLTKWISAIEGLENSPCFRPRSPMLMSGDGYIPIDPALLFDSPSAFQSQKANNNRSKSESAAPSGPSHNEPSARTPIEKETSTTIIQVHAATPHKSSIGPDNANATRGIRRQHAPARLDLSSTRTLDARDVWNHRGAQQPASATSSSSLVSTPTSAGLSGSGLTIASASSSSSDQLSPSGPNSGGACSGSSNSGSEEKDLTVLADSARTLELEPAPKAAEVVGGEEHVMDSAEGSQLS